MINHSGNGELSAREFETMQHDKTMLEMQLAHASRMKELDVEMERLSIKWASWLRLPFVIVTLPVRILFVLPLTVYAIRKQEVPSQYWKF